MEFDLEKVLGTAGPTASLVFASWIFLQYVNQRYATAYDEYRNLISQYRTSE